MVKVSNSILDLFNHNQFIHSVNQDLKTSNNLFWRLGITDVLKLAIKGVFEDEDASGIHI